MATRQAELLAVARRLIESSAPSSVDLGALYAAVERGVDLNAADLVPPTFRGKPTGEPSWRRNLRNALQQEKRAGRLANVEHNRWTTPTPVPSRHVDPDRAWGMVVEAAAESKGEVFGSPVRGQRYRVLGTEDGKVAVDRVDSSNQTTLSEGEVQRAVVALNAAGGRTGRRTLHYTVAKEAALVFLHPALSWEGGDIVAWRRGAGPQRAAATAKEALSMLTRGDVLAALRALDSGTETAFSDSTSYDLLHEGPPLRPAPRGRRRCGAHPRPAARAPLVRRRRRRGQGGHGVPLLPRVRTVRVRGNPEGSEFWQF